MVPVIMPAPWVLKIFPELTFMVLAKKWPLISRELLLPSVKQVVKPTGLDTIAPVALLTTLSVVS